MTILTCTSWCDLLVAKFLDVMTIVYYQVDVCVTQSVMCLLLSAIYVITDGPCVVCMHNYSLYHDI